MRKVLIEVKEEFEKNIDKDNTEKLDKLKDVHDDCKKMLVELMAEKQARQASAPTMNSN